MATPQPPTGSQHPPDRRLVGVPGESRDLRFYRSMFFIRRFEETLLSLFEEGLLNGTTHACIGQEADCVGVIGHLGPDDHVFSNHRGHGHYLMKTGDALGLLAEVMGKRGGVCRGIGGSQHIYAHGFKSNGILGGTVPAAAGIALAEQLRGSRNLSVVFVGDGTLGEGVLYETMNIASLWRLPLLVVLEDNGWSQSTPISVNVSGDIAARFEAFNLPVRALDTTDVLEIDRVAGEEIGLAREELAPRVLILHTYRLCHHSKNDDNRPVDEVEARWKIEPLAIHGSRLDAGQREAIERGVDLALAETVEQARALR